MSVLIKDMEKPKSCYAVIDGETKYCPFVNTDDDCVLQLEKGICEGTWADQYSKCPLIEAPKPCDDAVSRQAAIDALRMDIDIIPFAKAREYARAVIETVYNRLEELPSAQPDLSEYSDKLWRSAYERGKRDAQPEIVRCKDCKWKQGAECVRFAEIRPFPDDFCSRAERREE